jgi:PiT family inorganic phosphate transporter
MMILLFIVALLLAYSNGSNDNFKGVATLFGSKTTSYKNAINWATLTTFAGSVTAILLAGELVKNFSGKGLVPDELLQSSPEFAISIALGAALTVLLATKIGMPISTTHSLVGGLFGAGVMAIGSDFNFGKLTDKFLFPLIASPLMAAVVALIVYFVFTQFRKRLKIQKTTPGENESVSDEKYLGESLGIKNQKILDVAHFLSSGVVSFARGLNDTPKIVGLLLIINTLDIRIGMISIAIAMAIGGLLNAKKVGTIISKKITPMNSGQGFTANLITGILVTTASVHGMPVSTTHVSIGSIFGIGTVTRKANFGVIKKILASWILTLPIAAIFSGLIYFILSQF